MTDSSPIPKTAAEMTGLLMAAGLQRAYGDLAAAAWRQRLTNADIERVERSVLAHLQEAKAAADEFPHFDARAAVDEATAELRRFFAAAATVRVQQ